MKLIQLHWSDTNLPVWINPENITYAYRHKAGVSELTMIQFAGYGGVSVKETPEQIYTLAGDGGRLG